MKSVMDRETYKWIMGKKFQEAGNVVLLVSLSFWLCFCDGALMRELTVAERLCGWSVDRIGY
jgi:hypothetical protein